MEQSYQVRSIEELKAAADKELEETGNPSGPASMEYMEMLEQQRAMNPEADIGELETVSELWTPETSAEEVAHELEQEQSAEMEISVKAPTTKKKLKSKKDKEAEEQEEVGGKKRKLKSAGGDESAKKKKKTKKADKTEEAEEPVVDASLLSAIAPTTQEEEEDETNIMRRRIYHDLVAKGAFDVLRKNLITPHWAWRERDINWRHVDELSKGIVAEPFKTTKAPIVQPIEPKYAYVVYIIGTRML